jgi:hypothetical protein
MVSINQTIALDRLSNEDMAGLFKGSVLTLWTSAANKRNRYRDMFAALKADGDGQGRGVDLHFTDSGSFGVAPKKTPEKSGQYDSHSEEKLVQALTSAQENHDHIQAALQAGTAEQPEGRCQIHMVEDSGWEIVCPDEGTQLAFLQSVEYQVMPYLRMPDDQWLLNHLHESFPGPNLKPFQEHLPDEISQTVFYDPGDNAKENDIRKRLKNWWKNHYEY